MKKVYFLLNLVCLGFLIPGAFGQTTSFSFTTGVAQNYTVPAGVTQISIDLIGGKGGGSNYGNGGAGGRVQCTMNVTPGSVYQVYIGSVGAGVGSNSGTQGMNGTGHVGGNGSSFGGAGGGSSEIWLSGTPVVVAGAGGGGSWDCTSDHGGLGGGPTGSNGLQCGSYSATYCGTGGSPTAPGIGGSCGGASNGTLGSGGNGGGSTSWYSGGGAGYYGGGGGCSYGSGGGGSSYPASAGGNITAITHTQGYNNTGNGSCVITVLCSAPGTVSGASTVCQGATTTFADAGGASGGTWTSSNTAVATVNSSTGVVTGVAPGTATITYVLGSPCGGVNASATITVLAVPGSISGSLSACPGTTVTLSNPVSGGSWTSSATGIAVVGTSSGVVTPVSAGIATISYSLGNGCNTATAQFTVNTLPAAITGTGTVCQGSSVTLTETTGGGTWSSSSPAIGSVAGGVVAGLSGGTTNISYTTSGAGCYAVKPVTVNADAPISGSTSLCLGFTTTMTNATPGGGTWLSSNTSAASINSSGLVTGLALGSTTISFTSTTTGCVVTSPLNIVTTTIPYTVTGGGAYCAGGIGVVVGLNNSVAGVSYTLFNGATNVATIVSPAAGAISFGYMTVAGTYTVIASYGSPCSSVMLGSATVSINPLPTAFAVTGGGNYCIGGTGVPVGLPSSVIGTNYQLFVNGTPTGGAISGTGSAISFGLQTTTGTYTVVATITSTGCTANMTGSVTVGTNPLPTAFAVTSSGTGYCVGGAGVTIGLAGSAIGTNYQLLLGGSPVGSVVPGTGAAITFGLQTNAGTYTVSATNVTTSCTNLMSGSASITINPLPTAFTVQVSGGIGGTGTFCAGGTGVTVTLNGSQAGVSYQLVNGTTATGSPVAGTGTSISFGLQTVSGSYTVVATNTTTGCTNNMTGSVAVTTSPLPTVYSLTGGGGYCAGGTGVNVGLSGSNAGISYQLFNGTTLVGGASGSGSAVNFGLQTTPGVYTVVATNTTSLCSANMSGSATVVVNPLPAIFNVSAAGTGSYCAGGTGVPIILSGSAAGVNYQLFNGTLPILPVVSGTGAALTFPAQTAAGSYTAVAVNATTGCTSNMTGSGLVTINPLPTVYTITGGGGYCSGGTGVAIGLAGSNIGISYQLYNTVGASGSPVAGTGSAISFGLQTTSSTRDSVVATNTATGCVSVMSGNVPVSINGLPTQYSVTGGGSFCAGGTGVIVNLGGSTSGISYQLFNSGVATGAPLSGTGSGLAFGPLTNAGLYTVAATNVATGCTSNMVGSASIIVNPVPAIYAVTGGGSYCASGTGVHVGLTGSVTGINYQLYANGIAAGTLLPGNGLPLDFGAETGAGSYTVVAVTPGTFCQSNMSGSVNVVVNPLPSVYSVTQSAASYCAGGTGVHIGLSNSATGFSYQLLNLGVPSGAPLTGTGASLDFGLHTAAGAYTVVATNNITGCSANMTGTASVAVNLLPAAQTIIGGGSYCPGGSGVVVGLMGSASGISYQLFNGPVAVGSAVSGTGLPVSFGSQTNSGTYTVVATNTATGCVSNMPGSVAVSVYALPSVFNVTGGGNYCPGGSGSDIGLSGSSTGVSYQLFDGGAPMGAPVTGTGSAIDFGLQMTPGSYTVIASNGITSCSSTMFGSATVGTYPLPASFNVTGGGSYCSGGTGVVIGLNGSATGVNYHMFLSGVPAGSTVAGTGSSVSFGSQTVAGTYTVIATNTTTGCSNTMTGTAVVSVTPLPSVFSISGGGNYCAGSAGSPVSIGGSDPAASYQLYNGVTPSGTPVPGTGGVLNFGPQTAGTYTVLAINNTTGCTAPMTGSVTIGINPLPTPFSVLGGGNYCAGGSGVHLGLSNSNVGVSYQVFDSGIALGSSVAGTGAALDLGLQTASGTYTVVGTATATGCTNNMLGSQTVAINPLPALHGVVSTATSYCAGGAGVEISLDGSDAGISYQLNLGTAPATLAVDGTGGPVSLGWVTSTGTYSVVAKNTATGCSVNLTPSIPVVVNSLPAVFTVTGGGHYCNSGTGVHIGLSNSNAGVNYQLYHAGSPVGSPVTGTGTSIDFGLETASGSYTVVATNNTTTCNNNMTGSATVAIDALPLPFNISGGGSYCAGGPGVVVGMLGSSIGISYQLLKNGVSTGSPVNGTASAFNFGMQTGAGVYTVKATNAVTGCSAIMTGTETVAVNPLPVAYPVTGGGNYCSGGTGVNVGISGSNSGITYQLVLGSTPVGTGVPGVTGTSVSFGPQTAAGTYTIIGIDNFTGCTAGMSGAAIVGVNALPASYAVLGGGSYCAGGSGVNVGLAGSNNGINYSLYNGTSSLGTLTGTGGPLDFGLQTLAGGYSVKATNTTTGCSTYMSGTANIVVNPGVTPLVTVHSGAGDSICGGSYTTFTAITVNSGTAPTFQWSVNGVVTGTGTSYSYIPVDGDAVGVTMVSNQNCAMPSSASNSLVMNVTPNETPVVAASADPGAEVCQGSTVTYTATSSFGGSAPVYTWIRNGSATTASGTTFSYVPADGDIVYCVMHSNYRCASSTTASSNHISMKVDAPLLPVVNISSSVVGTLTAGVPVTLIANIINGGPSPMIQWFVNGVAIPNATGTAFTNTFANGDSISCEVISSGGCSGLVGYNSITLHVANVGVKPVTGGTASLVLVPNPNNGQFTLKGSIGNATEEVALEVVNMLGQVVYSQHVSVHNGEINEHIQLTGNQPNGMYLLNLRSATENMVFHFVVEQ